MLVEYINWTDVLLDLLLMFGFAFLVFIGYSVLIDSETIASWKKKRKNRKLIEKGRRL